MAAVDPSLPPMNSGLSAESLNYVDATASLSVTVRQPEQAVLVIHIAGELDMLTGPRLEEHLCGLLDTRPERLIIDLSQVSFLGSNGLSVLIGAQHTAARQGTTLQLSGTSHRAVARPLRLTALNQLLDTPPPATEGSADVS
jgi:anti-sigma B factor antagonist